MSVSELAPGFLSVGHHVPREAVRRADASGRLQRTILIHGPAGAGKGAFVEDLLALLLCGAEDAAGRPCNACRACGDARGRRHPDLVVGSPQLWREARSTGESIVGAARRWILESAGTPIAGERRVILIEGLDRANEQTQNALLKVLEEPSARQMFVLVADDIGRVLPTIVSRAQALRIGSVGRGELIGWLMDHERLPADQAEVLARLADGLPGRAIGYARDPQLVDWRRRTQAELLGLRGRGLADRFGSVRDLLDHPVPGADASAAVDPVAEGDGPARTPAAVQRGSALAIVDAWQSLARDLLVCAAGRAGMAPSAQLLPELQEASASMSGDDLVAFVDLLDRIRDGLLQNASPRLALEVAMLRWPSA